MGISRSAMAKVRDTSSTECWKIHGSVAFDSRNDDWNVDPHMVVPMINRLDGFIIEAKDAQLLDTIIQTDLR